MASVCHLHEFVYLYIYILCTLCTTGISQTHVHCRYENCDEARLPLFLCPTDVNFQTATPTPEAAYQMLPFYTKMY